MFEKNEATTLTTNAEVKFPTGFALKQVKTTLTRRAAMPLLKTVENVPSQLLPRVPWKPPFVSSLLWTCLKTSMPVLIVTLRASMTFVTFGRARIVPNEVRTFTTKNMPKSNVVLVTRLGTKLQHTTTQRSMRVNVTTNETTLLRTVPLLSDGLIILLRMTCVGVGTPFDPNMPVKLPVLLEAKPLETLESLLATLAPIAGNEHMQPLSMTVTLWLTPLPARWVYAPVFLVPTCTSIPVEVEHRLKLVWVLATILFLSGVWLSWLDVPTVTSRHVSRLVLGLTGPIAYPNSKLCGKSDVIRPPSSTWPILVALTLSVIFKTGFRPRTGRNMSKRGQWCPTLLPSSELALVAVVFLIATVSLLVATLAVELAILLVTILLILVILPSVAALVVVPTLIKRVPVRLRHGVTLVHPQAL